MAANLDSLNIEDVAEITEDEAEIKTGHIPRYISVVCLAGEEPVAKSYRSLFFLPDPLGSITVFEVGWLAES
jgi:hypothetical protein